MQAVGLTNTRKVRHAERFRSATEAIRLLKRKTVGTTADDFGSISVWDDKEGRYRCEAYRWMQTVDSQVFTSYQAVRQWLKVWMKKIGEKEG